jgi:hypothetical protein
MGGTLKYRGALILVLLLGCSPIAELNTQYSRPDLKKQFAAVKVGDSVRGMYDILGPPLCMDINPDRFGNGAYRQVRSSDVSLSAVMEVATNSNKEAYLIYSQPKKAGKDYLLFRVDVHDGQVFRKEGPAYMD